MWIRVLAALCGIACACAQTAHLGNIRQLTNGGQNAEAYWSPDGQQIVFQSTRDELGCDQILTMDADGSRPASPVPNAPAAARATFGTIFPSKVAT